MEELVPGFNPKKRHFIWQSQFEYFSKVSVRVGNGNGKIREGIVPIGNGSGIRPSPNISRFSPFQTLVTVTLFQIKIFNS